MVNRRLVLDMIEGKLELDDRVEGARNRSADSGCTEVFIEELRTHEKIKIGGCFTVDETSAFQATSRSHRGCRFHRKNRRKHPRK